MCRSSSWGPRKDWEHLWHEALDFSSAFLLDGARVRRALSFDVPSAEVVRIMDGASRVDGLDWTEGLVVVEERLDRVA